MLAIMVLGMCAASLALGAKGATTSVDPDERLRAVSLASVTMQQAYDEASRQVIGGIMTAIELTIDQDKPVYIATIAIGTRDHRVTIDAITGDAIASETGRTNPHISVLHARLVEQEHVGLLKAAEIAREQMGGVTAFASHAVVKGDKVFFEVWVIEGSVVKVVRLTTAGEFIETTERLAPDKSKK